MSALPILVLGFTPMIVLPLVPLIGFYALMVHANLDWDLGLLRCVIASPVFHRWHHSKNPEAVDKNFAALFVFWDALFGTLYMPRGISPGNFGVPEKAAPSFLGQLADRVRGALRDAVHAHTLSGLVAGIRGTSDDRHFQLKISR